MPPNTPIFTDVASRLRHGHVSAGNMVSMVSGLEMATATVATAQRLPSTRPLDHRWDRSRGIVFKNVKRRIHTDRTWTHVTGIIFAPPASERSYATREIGASTAQRSTVKTASGSTSYLDNVHRVPGFGGSSPKQIEELSEKIKQLEADVLQKRQHIVTLNGSIESRDGTLAKRERELKKSQDGLGQMKAAHKKEIDKLQGSIRQEKEARKIELHTVSQKHARELQEVRDSAGLAEDSPVLQAARAEGGKLARQLYDEQLQELKEQHELELKREKALRTDLETWKQRNENENRHKAGQEAAVIQEMRDEMYSLRQERSKAEFAAKDERKLNDRLRARVTDLRKELAGRKARTEENRKDYFGYRELFHDMGDQVYEVLGGATSIREALEKEAQLWRKSVWRFQQDKQLLFFRQQPKYNTLKSSINKFLEGRAAETQAAATRARELAGKLLETRKSLNLQSHASRMVTRYLHFDKEPTEARGVSVAHYMSLVLPFTQRIDDCAKELNAVEQKIKKLRDASSEVPAELQHGHAQLRDRKEILICYLKFAGAFRSQEAMAALLHSTPEDRITFVRMRGKRDRFRAMMDVVNEAESRGQKVTGAIRRQLAQARERLEQLETFVRTRVIVQQDLEQLDEAVIEEADQDLRKRLAVYKRNADVALNVLAGQRKSLAVTFRERKLELSKSAATTASSSIEDLAASLKSGLKLAADKPVVARSSRRTPQAARAAAIVHHKGRLAALKMRAKNSGDIMAASRVKATKKKLRELQMEQAKEQASARTQRTESPNVRHQKTSQNNLQASASVGGLKITPTQPMQAPHLTPSSELSQHETQVSRWSTLNDALGSRAEATSNHATISPSSSSLQAVLHSQNPAKAHMTSYRNNTTRSRNVSAATRFDQSAGKDASSRDATRTQRLSAGNTSTSAEPHASSSELHDFAMPLEESSSQESNVDIDAVSLPSSLSSYVPSDSDGSEAAGSAPGSPPPPEDDPAWTPEPHTILDYQIPQKAYRDAVMASTSSNAAFWTHQLYKSSDGRSPVVYYCKNLETAERQCKLFLKEPVLGFDLEWEINASLHKSPVKKCVSLIQLASEDKICLIHVACFAGEKVEQLLPPSLKTILEDDNIVKAGVNISGDANRMRHCFGVDMKGVFELSHMYRLVKTPDQVSFKLVGLAAQVQNTLLLPLKKDDVRVSAWSKTLNAQQCVYAAADAYAGFRLFYQLDNLRKDLRPTPPRPAFFETYKPIILGDGTAIERASFKPRAGTKKAAASGEADESDDEFFDALEDLPDTYELPTLALKDGKVDIDEADPESVAALRDMMENTSLADPSPSADSKAVSNTTDNAADTQAKAKPPKQAPHVLVASPETILADMWISSLPSRNPKVGAASLRAYHLWHHQNHGLDAVAGLCRQPPLAMTSVASYIMTAIKEEDMPYDKARLKEAFVHLPKSVWHVYGKWVKELGLDK